MSNHRRLMGALILSQHVSNDLLQNNVDLLWWNMAAFSGDMINL